MHFYLISYFHDQSSHFIAYTLQVSWVIKQTCEICENISNKKYKNNSNNNNDNNNDDDDNNNIFVWVPRTKCNGSSP